MNVHVSPAAITRQARQARQARRLAKTPDLNAPLTDNELLTLGQQLRQAFGDEMQAEEASAAGVDLDTDPRYLAANGRCKELIAKIEAIQPTTFDGVAVKMLAIAWTYGQDLLAPPTRPAADIHERILASFVPAMLRATALMPSVQRA